MEYVRLGNTGLRVSRIALGCMSYGAREFHQWTLDEEESQPFFCQAVELGITLWDTANGYGGGTSEEFVGRAIRRFARREDIVVATKVYNKMHDGPGGAGLSRKAILEQLDASLSRLGTDYIDLYYIHRFDPDVPVEETMTALHDTAGLLVVTSDTRQNQTGAKLRLAFLSAIVALVAAFAASASPIPVYNTYRAEQGFTNVSLTVVAYFAGTITALLVLGRLSTHLGRRPVAIATMIPLAAGAAVLLDVHSNANLIICSC